MLDIKEVAFCTYFDKNYLPKGLAMLSSFVKYNPKAVIYVLCFDNLTFKFIKGLKVNSIQAISLSEFEDKQLLEVKQSRSIVEYYWTCTPSLPLYVLKTYSFYKAVCYLDGDLFFYNSIDPVLKELGVNSIYTVEHRYPVGQEGREKTSGRFNVAFQIFRKDREGLKCLSRWRNQCLKWCFWKEEKGKMGDQMYLNEWPKLYKKLVISKHLGVDTAPWNVSQYKIWEKQGKVFVNEFPLICYHFHQLQIKSKSSFEYASGYSFSKKIKDLIYKPYVKVLSKKIEYIQRVYPNYVLPINRTPFLIRIKIF